MLYWPAVATLGTLASLIVAASLVVVVPASLLVSVVGISAALAGVVFLLLRGRLLPKLPRQIFPLLVFLSPFPMVGFFSLQIVMMKSRSRFQRRFRKILRFVLCFVQSNNEYRPSKQALLEHKLN